MISALGGGGKWIPRAHSLVYLMGSRLLGDPGSINSWTAPEEQQQRPPHARGDICVCAPTHTSYLHVYMKQRVRTYTQTKEKKKKILFSNTVP